MTRLSYTELDTSQDIVHHSRWSGKILSLYLWLVKRTNTKRKPTFKPQPTYFATSVIPDIARSTDQPEPTYFYSNKLGTFVRIR